MTTNWDPRTGRLVTPPTQPSGYPSQPPAQPQYPSQIRPAEPPPRTDYQALAAQLSAPAQPVAPPPSKVAMPPKAAPPPKGWWRRNRWGLLLLIPVFVLALVPPVISTYDMLWKRQERLPLAGGTTTWVTYGGVRVRLVELSEEKDLPGYGGRREPAPAGMRVVRVVLGFDGPGDALAGCEVWLESTADERFSANPDELDDAKLPYGSCGADDAIQPSASADPSPSVTSSPDPKAVQQWRTETYFVMPLTSYPRSVRIVVRTQLPEYIVLS